jgi:DNA-binding PadR family transcriptional regulator
MAVRDALLALLTMGPAYGFALHGGLSLRTGGRRTVNVGQTYATLERLTKQGLVESAGTTADGLPLHRLTATGEQSARAWLDGTDAAGSDAWDETLDRVLIACSLPGWDSAAIIEQEHARWLVRRDDAAAAAAGEGAAAASETADGDQVGRAAGVGTALARLAASADLARAEAMLDWLRTSEISDELAIEPLSERPRRGRRPAWAGTPTSAQASASS